MMYDNPDDDPRQRIRNRVIQQGSGPVPNDSPSAPAPSPDFTPANGNTGFAGGYKPQVQPQTATQPPINNPAPYGYSKPPAFGGERNPYDPNSPEGLAYENSLYGEHGKYTPQALTGPAAQAAPTSAYLKSLLDSGLSARDAVAQFNRETGRTTGNEAVFYEGNNTIGLPDSYLAGGSGGWNVVQRMAEGSGGAGSQPSAVSPFIAGIRQQLLARMAKDTAPVDMNDPEVAAPYNAAKLASDRELEQSNKENAQAAYAQAANGGGVGIDQAALGQQATQGRERAASSLGVLRGNVVAKLIQAKRDDLNSAFQQALASGDTEAARKIQMQAMELDNEYRNKSLGFDMAKFAQGQNNAAFGAGA